MKHVLSLMLFATIAISTAYAGPPNAAPAAKPTYRIGLLAALSGDGASLGTGIRDSVLLAADELSGEERSGISILVEDDQFQPAKAVAAFEKLMADTPLNAVIVIGSAMGHAIAPLAQQRGVILISVGASDSSFIKDRPLCFIHWVVPEKETAALAGEIESRGYKRIGMISNEHPGIVAFNEILLHDLKERKLDDRIVLNESFSQETSDFRSFITRAQSKNVEAVYTALWPGSLAAFARQLRSFGPKQVLFGVETLEDEHEVRASNGALVGAWYVNASDPSPSFIKAYRARFDIHPGWATSNAYDALRLLANGVSRFGHDNTQIAAYLRTVKDYDGAAGRYSARGDNRFDLPVAVKRVTEQGFETIAGGEKN